MSDPVFDVRYEHRMSDDQAIELLKDIATRAVGLFPGMLSPQLIKVNTDYGTLWQPGLIEVMTGTYTSRILGRVKTRRSERILIDHTYVAMFSGGTHLVFTGVVPELEDITRQEGMTYAERHHIATVRVHVAS